MQQNVIRYKMLVQQDVVWCIEYRKHIISLYIILHKFDGKMCKYYINSMEKCAECDNIRYEKCEITAKYPMKNVE